MDEDTPQRPRSVVEFLFKHDDGRSDVRYRYDYGSKDANELIRRIDQLRSMLGDLCLWEYRYA